MLPLFLLLGAGAGAYLGNAIVTGTGLRSPDLAPTIAGYPSSTVLGVGGLLLGAMVGGPLGLALAAAGGGALSGGRTLGEVRDGLVQAAKREALPGGGAAAPRIADRAAALVDEATQGVTVPGELVY